MVYHKGGLKRKYLLDFSSIFENPLMPQEIPTYRDGDQILRPDPNYEMERGVKAGRLNLVCVSHNQYYGTKLAKNVLPGLNTTGYWDADCDQQWGTDWHYNEGLELTLIENGQLTFNLEGKTTTIQPYDATFTRPWLRHCVGDPHVGPSRIYWIVLDVGIRRPHQAWKWPSWILLTPRDRKELVQLSEQYQYHIWKAGPDYRRCFHRLGDAILTNGAEGNVSLIACLVNEALFLLLQALRVHHEKEAVGSDTFQEITRLFWQEIKQNPSQLGLDWTLTKMVRRCGIGKTQFVFYTKQVFNLTPMHYLNRCRLELAADLLKSQPHRSITEVALDCGFSTSQQFAKSFRYYYKCTPRIYRSGTQSLSQS
jgi:AraC-like DNA-binding protein